MANTVTLSGTLGQIQPLTMPAASAVEFAGGDVEHLSPTVGLDYRTISNSTRELAYRDNVLATKVNELITVVNNKEQIIALPTVRTSLVPGEVLLATNYRIPSGYEARVLNGSVASSPDGSVLLEILYSQNTFGSSDGDSIVSTYSEAGAATSFQGTGEFVVRLTNVSANPADVSASVFFTLRPAGDLTGGVIGPGVQGEPGQKGDPGEKGDQGSTGAPGAPGSAGITWRGTYDAGASYTLRDGINYTFSGTTGTASFINLAACSGIAPPLPENAPSANWDLLASGSVTGYGQGKFISTADAAVVNTTAETSLIGAGVGSRTLPANFWEVGRVVKLNLGGVMRDAGATSLTVRAKLGLVTLATTGTLALVGSTSNSSFKVALDMVCRSTGATGAVAVTGSFIGDTTLHVANILGLASASPVTIDTTTSALLDVTAQWYAGSLSNAITGQTTTIEVVN
jgi:hypothetical protein